MYLRNTLSHKRLACFLWTKPNNVKFEPKIWCTKFYWKKNVLSPVIPDKIILDIFRPRIAHWILIVRVRNKLFYEKLFAPILTNQDESVQSRSIWKHWRHVWHLATYFFERPRPRRIRNAFVVQADQNYSKILISIGNFPFILDVR